MTTATTAGQQYQHWLDFAQRMARHAWPNMTEKRKRRLRDDVTGFIESYKEEPNLGSWDEGPLFICDHFREYFEEHDERRWEGDWPLRSYINQLACCIRSGLDVAVAPSAGVVGFTVGDLRRMYDGQIPAWISEGYTNDLAGAEEDTGIWL